jgi:hypothetical protein
MTDFQRLITALPSEPSWTAPNPSQRQEVNEHASDLSDATRPSSPELRPEDFLRIFSRQRTQFNDSNQAFWDSWLSSYQYYANNTPTGVRYHQQAVGLLYFLLEGALENPDAHNVSELLHRFNEQWGRYHQDLISSSLSAESKASDINGILLPSARALLQLISASPVASDESVSRELVALAGHTVEGYRGLIQVSQGDENLRFLREYAQAQMEIIELRSPSIERPFSEQLQRARSIAAHLQRAEDAARQLTPAEHSPIADDRTLVQEAARVERQGFHVPSESELARNLITSNTLLMVSTVGSEIDLMHRDPEARVNERYFRFSQAMETILAANPEMNFRQAYDSLRNLRFSDAIYDRVAASDVPVDQALEIFSGRRQDTALRTRLLSIVRHPGEPPRTDAEIAAILEGTPRVRQMAPILISNLIHYIDRLGADDPNREWLIHYFQPTEREINLSMAHEQLQMAWASHEAPSNEFVRALSQTGAPGRELVEGFIRDRRREAEAQGHTFTPPEWLTNLSHQSFQRPENHTLQDVRADLVRVQHQLENGETLRSRQDRTFDNLINLFTDARDQDAAHLNELLTDRSLLDEDQRFLHELIDLDGAPLTPSTIGWRDSSHEPHTANFVNHWARRVLERVDAHTNNFAEAFTHDNENHLASFRVIWSLIGGEGSGSLNGQLRQLTDSGLDTALQTRAHRAEARTHTVGFRIETVWQNFASAENLAFMGLMVGSSQAATRAVTSTEVVASGARITMGDFLQAMATRMAGGRRWLAWLPAAARLPAFAMRSPVTTALTTSATVGLLYALGNEEIHQRSHESSTFGHDFWVGSGVTLGLTAPLWFPRWVETSQSFRLAPQWLNNWAPVLARNERLTTLLGAPLLGGTALAGFHRLTDPHSQVGSDFLLGAGLTATYLAPAILPRVPGIGPSLAIGIRASGRGMENLSVVAEGGQLGFAGHTGVALTTGLFTGGVGAGLQYEQDRAGGYDTHFGHDLAMSTVTMGVGLSTSALLNSAINRLFMRRASARIAHAVEQGETLSLTRSAPREAALVTSRTLLSAAVATGGMLLGTAESRALSSNRYFPNRQDFHFEGEEIGVTFANMLAFEMLNGGINRLTLRSTLGRPRATQIDHLVSCLMEGVTLPQGESPETMRNFLWNRLAIEALRGTDLSPLSSPERLRAWQVSFQAIRSEHLPTEGSSGGSGGRGGIRGFARRLLDRMGRSDLDQSPNRSLRSPLLAREGRYGMTLTPRDRPLPINQELTANVGAFSVMVVPQMIRAGRGTPPPLEFFLDHDGTLHPSRPHGDMEVARLRIEFTADQIYLSPTARRTIDRFVTSPEARNRLLALHGERLLIPPIARAYTNLVRDISNNPHLMGDISLFIVRTNPNEAAADTPPTHGGSPSAPSAEPRLLYQDENFTIYQGPLANVPEDRRGANLYCEVVVPTRRSRSGITGPLLRVRQGSGRFMDLDVRLRGLFGALERSEGVAPTLTTQIGTTSFTLSLPSVHLGERVTVTPESLGRDGPSGTVTSRLPEDLRFIIERSVENEWRIINDSERTVITVGTRRIRPHQSTELSHRVRITVPENRGSRSLRLDFTLPEDEPGAPPPPPRGGGGSRIRSGLGSGSSRGTPGAESSRAESGERTEENSTEDRSSEILEGEVVEVEEEDDPTPRRGTPSGGPPGDPENPPIEAAPSAPQSEEITEGGAILAPGETLSPSALRTRVQQKLRQRLVHESQSRRYRDSRTAFSLNRIEIEVAVGIETGEFLSLDEENLQSRSYARLRISADLDSNRIQIDPESASGMRESLSDPLISATTRTLLQAILDLHGQAIVTRSETPSAMPAWDGGEGSIQVLSPFSPRELQQMRETIRELLRSDHSPGGGSMTLLMGTVTQEIPWNVFQGVLVLNAEGQVVAMEIGRPTLISPRGTRYRTGIMEGGNEIPVVIDSQGNLIHFETTAELNETQTGALISYFGEVNNQRARAEILSQSPYLIDMITRSGTGNLLNHLNSILNSLRGEVAGGGTVRSRVFLVQQGTTFGLARESTLAEMIEQGWRPLLSIDIEYGTRDGAGILGEQVFNYSVPEGSLPREVSLALDYVRARFAGEEIPVTDPQTPTLRPPPSDGREPTRPFTLEGQRAPQRLLRFSYEVSPESIYRIDLPLFLETSSGDWVGTLGREHFSFLDATDRAVISRRHAQFRLTPQGQLYVEPLTSQSGLVGTRHGVGSDSSFPLSLPDTFYLITTDQDIPLTLERVGNP